MTVSQARYSPSRALASSCLAHVSFVMNSKYKFEIPLSKSTHSAWWLIFVFEMFFLSLSDVPDVRYHLLHADAGS